MLPTRVQIKLTALFGVVLLSTAAFAAESRLPSQKGSASAAPASLGGTGGNAQKVASPTSKIKVEERKDNIVEKKKSKSLREKREEKGGRLSHNEIARVQVEHALTGALDQEIAYMEKLLVKLPKNSPQRAEMLRRLVENTHQRALLSFFEESRQYDANWKKWNDGGRRGTEPMLTQKQSKIWVSRVVQRAQMMITEYPKHPNIDEAYYQIGYALEQTGQRKEAAGYYSQLVARFPNSKRIADAHFSLGEYYFDKQDFRKALTSYSEVRRYASAPIYPWAIYKMAWSYFNLQDYRNALGQWQAVVSLSNTAAGLTQANRIKLKDEALRDMVNAYAELGDLEGAEKYFSQVGSEKYFADLLLRLADLLRERGQYDQSVKVLKRFALRNPTNIKAAEVQIQIVDTANLKIDKKMLWEEMRFMLTNMGPNSPWTKANANEHGFKELEERMHTVSLTYPKKMHSMAQKDNNRYFYGQAIIGYNLYLSAYGNRPEAEEVRFLLGEIQYNLAQYRDAVRTFFALASLKEKTKYFAKSGEYLISASYLPIEKDMKALRARPAKLGAQPLAVPAPMQEYVKVCDQFIEWFPKDKKVLNCQVDVAEIYFKHYVYGEAEKRLLVLAKTYPTRPEGKKASEALLFLAANDKQKLLALADALSKTSAEYSKGDIGKRLYGIKEAQLFEQTLSLEKSGKFLKAAQEFERLGTNNPNGADADKAFFNAGVNYKKAGEPDKAIVAYTKVYTSYPKSAQAADAMLAVIEINAERLQLDRTAQVSQLFLSRHPKDKRANTVLRENCFIYDALNDVPKATQTCNKVIAAKDPSAKQAAFTLADVYERNSKNRELIAIIDSVILRMPLNESERIEVLARAATAERKLGKNSAARDRDAKISGIYRSNSAKVQGAALAHVGKIEFDKATPVMQRFQSMRLSASKRDGSDLMGSIKNKTAALQQVEASFKKVVSTGDAEWGVAALFIIGSAYEMLAADLRNPPTPPGAPAADVQKIRDTLGNLSKGLVEKSKVFYAQSAEAVTKFGIYTPFAKKNADALARVNPKDFRKVEEWVPEGVFVGSQWMQISQTSKVFAQIEGAKQ